MGTIAGGGGGGRPVIIMGDDEPWMQMEPGGGGGGEGATAMQHWATSVQVCDDRPLGHARTTLTLPPMPATLPAVYRTEGGRLVIGIEDDA